jgi:hypothetical protein
MNKKERNFKDELQHFCEKYSIKILEENWQYVDEGQAHELSDSMYSLFEGTSFEDVLETGMPPSDFLPELVEGLVGMVQAEDWKVRCVESDDEWSTANVKIESSAGEVYSFRIEDVDNQDWVPVDVFDKVNTFAKKNANYSLSVFYSDDPYRVLPLPHDAFNELEAIIERYTNPYEF